MFNTSKCYFCNQKDLKSHMSVAFYGIYSLEKQYFHQACLTAIICEPEAHDHITVDKALWVETCVANAARDEASKLARRKQRLEEAQSRICG